MLSERAEDMLGKLLMIGVFGFSAVRQLIAMLQFLQTPQLPGDWPIIVISQLLTFVFVGLVVVMTMRRLPPRQTAEGIEPRITAIAGTFFLILLTWLEPTQISSGVRLVATVMIAVGTAGSIYCLRYLGRSFAIMASARELVTRGPYGVVRHPLYLVEAITVAGIVIAHGTAAALLVGTVQMLLQLRRMFNEEQVLRAAFPTDYAAYAAEVPMLVPGMRRSVPAG